MDFFVTLLVAFSLIFFFGRVFRELKLPRALGHICAGLIIGSAFVRPLLFDANMIASFDALADFGIVLLFFFAGLKISVPTFLRNLKESVSISVLNTLFPMVAAFIFMIALGYGAQTALIIGLIISVSSLAIIVSQLDELGLLTSKMGNLIVNAGSVDDLIEMTILAGILAAIGISLNEDPIVFVIKLAFFVVALVAAKFLIIPNFFKVLKNKPSQESMFAASLFIALLMAALANLVGFGAVIGALIAGALVRHFLSTESHRPWEEHKISNDIHMIGFGMFIPIFFAWTGFNTDLSVLSSQPILVFGLFIISMVLGSLGTYMGVKLSKGTDGEARLVAVGMSVKGDAELAVGFAALETGLITQDLFSAIVIVSILSSILPPIIFNRLALQYKRHLAATK